MLDGGGEGGGGEGGCGGGGVEGGGGEGSGGAGGGDGAGGDGGAGGGEGGLHTLLDQLYVQTDGTCASKLVCMAHLLQCVREVVRSNMFCGAGRGQRQLGRRDCIMAARLAGDCGRLYCGRSVQLPNGWGANHLTLAFCQNNFLSPFHRFLAIVSRFQANFSDVAVFLDN